MNWFVLLETVNPNRVNVHGKMKDLLTCETWKYQFSLFFIFQKEKKRSTLNPYESIWIIYLKNLLG
jgi:hypothetical protein